MSDVPMLPLDTTPEADALQIAAYRRMGGMGRVATVFRLNAAVRAAAMAGIRGRHPDYDDTQVLMAWRRLVLGDAVMRRVFPNRELVAP
jgi:hypothetical protein